MANVPDSKLTEQDRAVIYQLEKVDQGGDVADLFEDRMDVVADAFGLEREDDEESLHYGDIALGDGRYAALTFSAVIEDGSAPVVYVAQRFTLWPECPEDLEAEDATTIGVYTSHAAAEQVMAEDGAELWAELEDEDEEDKSSFMTEYRWAIDTQPVLS